MAHKWTEKKESDPEAAPIIQEGLNKLDVYRERADLVPAYVMAMSKIHFLNCCFHTDWH